MPRARNPLRADNTTSSMNSNAVLLHEGELYEAESFMGGFYSIHADRKEEKLRKSRKLAMRMLSVS